MLEVGNEQGGTEVLREAEGKRERQTERERERHTEKQRWRRKERQTGRQAGLRLPGPRVRAQPPLLSGLEQLLRS